jgi:ASCH domain
MRAMTVRQPWARAIAIGRKNIENRSRNVGYRGEIAIHAALQPATTADWDPRIVNLLGPDPRVGAPTGSIVAVARMVDCHEAVQSLPGGMTCCTPWGDRAYNGKPAFHFVLEDVRGIPRPVRCRGALQIGWKVPAEVEEQVLEQLAAVA